MSDRRTSEPRPREGRVPFRIILEGELPQESWNDRDPQTMLNALLVMLQLDEPSLRPMAQEGLVVNPRVRATLTAQEQRGEPELDDDDDPAAPDDHEGDWRTAYDAVAALAEAVGAQQYGYQTMDTDWLRDQFGRVQIALNALLVMQPPAPAAGAHVQADVREELGQHLERFGMFLNEVRAQQVTDPARKLAALADAVAALGSAVGALAVLHPGAP